MTGADPKRYCQNWYWSVLVCIFRQSLSTRFTVQSHLAQKWRPCPIRWNEQPVGVILSRSQFWKHLRGNWCEPSPQSIQNWGRLLFHWLLQVERFCMETILSKHSTTLVKRKG